MATGNKDESASAPKTPAHGGSVGPASDDDLELRDDDLHPAAHIGQGDSFEDEVRKLAYRLWIDEGRPHGREEIHWRIAEDAVRLRRNEKS